MSQKVLKETVEIEIKLRLPGKSFSRKLRRNKLVPSILYGPKKKNKTFSISEMEAIRYSSHKYENTIFTLKSKEDSSLNQLQVLKKDVSLDPVTRKPLHMDFYAIDMTKPVRVHVELQFKGKALGEKENGVFNAMRRDIEIECLPSMIPKFFIVDISHLNLNDVLHVSDIKIPSEIKLITDSKETVATVSLITEEVVEPEAEASAVKEGETSLITPSGKDKGASQATSKTDSKAPSEKKKSETKKK